MARRRRGGLLEDLMELGAKLPWFVSVILAVVVFAGLSWYSRDFSVDHGFVAPADAGAFARHRMFVVIASILKWIIPVALIIGAAVSAMRGRRK